MNKKFNNEYVSILQHVYESIDFVASKFGSIVTTEHKGEIGQVQVNSNKYNSSLSHL